MFLRNGLYKTFTDNYRVILSAFGLLILAGLLHPPVSNLMINSDTFVQLLSARMLIEHGSFTGYLGVGGDLLSPLFYRGGFSLLIAAFSFLGSDLFLVARGLIAFFFYLIIISVFFILNKFYKLWPAIIGTVLLIFSYSFSSWSTVVMAEIPTIGLICLALVFLIVAPPKNIWLVLSAIIFGLALTCRLEMLLFLPGWLILMNYRFKKLGSVVFYALISFLVWSVYFTWLYLTHLAPGPWLAHELVILKQTLITHQLFLYFIPVGLIFVPLAWRWRWLSFLPVFGIIAYILLVRDLLPVNWPPLLMFIGYDFFIILAGLLGIVMLYWRQPAIFYSVYLPVLFLTVLYYSRGEYRYYVHLVLPLILAAGAFFAWLIRRPRTLAVSLTIMMIGGQMWLFCQPRFLPQESYEQLIIAQTSEVITQNNIPADNLVICSVFSEAFFYQTGFSAQDCFAGQTDVERGRFPKLIVVDEDISRHQPDLVAWLDQNFADRQIGQSWLVTEYIEKNDTSITRFPVKWYLIDRVN